MAGSGALDSFKADARVFFSSAGICCLRGNRLLVVSLAIDALDFFSNVSSGTGAGLRFFKISTGSSESACSSSFLLARGRLLDTGTFASSDFLLPRVLRLLTGSAFS